MASIEKYTDSGTVAEISHDERLSNNHSNENIVPSKSSLNYSLLNRNISSFDYYKLRKSELYIYNRGDVKTSGGWVVSLPRELYDLPKEQHREFFQHTLDFLENRYGAKNTISATVHYDEIYSKKITSKLTGEDLHNPDGSIKKEEFTHIHLHYRFIPVVPDNNPKHIQAEKICCKEVINKTDLKTFHSDLQKYLDTHTNLNCKVLTGITKAQGRNYSVEEIKEKHAMEKELERLREIEKKYNQEHIVQERGVRKW